MDTHLGDAPQFADVEKVGRGPTTLILVPCLGCDWTSYDQFMAANADRFTMYAVTWPGMAASPLPQVNAEAERPYWEYVLQAMETLIRERNLERPVLVGHSAAGPYVIEFARRWPALVGGAVSVDAVITNRDTLGFSRAQRQSWAESEMADVLRRYDSEEAWLQLNTAPASLGGRSDFYTRMWRRPPRAHVFSYWRDWLMTDAGGMLPELQVPVLAIYAIRPTVQDPSAFRCDIAARFVANGIPTRLRLHYIRDSGHTIWEYQPEAFSDALADFATSLRSGSSETEHSMFGADRQESCP